MAEDTITLSNGVKVKNGDVFLIGNGGKGLLFSVSVDDQGKAFLSQIDSISFKISK